jgi:hypothetical protein
MENSEFKVVRFAKAIGKNTSNLTFYDMFQFFNYLTNGCVLKPAVKIPKIRESCKIKSKTAKTSRVDTTLAKILA